MTPPRSPWVARRCAGRGRSSGGGGRGRGRATGPASRAPGRIRRPGRWGAGHRLVFAPRASRAVHEPPLARGWAGSPGAGPALPVEIEPLLDDLPFDEPFRPVDLAPPDRPGEAAAQALVELPEREIGGVDSQSPGGDLGRPPPGDSGPADAGEEDGLLPSETLLGSQDASQLVQKTSAGLRVVPGRNRPPRASRAVERPSASRSPATQRP